MNFIYNIESRGAGKSFFNRKMEIKYVPHNALLAFPAISLVSDLTIPFISNAIKLSSYNERQIKKRFDCKRLA